jgi:DNA-binding transcriptional LysR family regulator
MDTAEIEVFLALAEELHFGRTAERLRLPPSQVSRLVARLERHAGGVLFDRTSRSVRLTPLGARLRARLQPAYAEITAALDEARAAFRGVTGLLRVGFTVTTPSEPLNRLVAAFETAHPDCRIILVEHPLTGDDWDVWRPLRDGRSEVLVYWGAADGEPDLTVGPVISHGDRVLLVARGHQLAGRDSVSAEELAGERVCARAPTLSPAIYEMFIPPVTPSGRPIPRGESASSIHEILSLVARGRIVHAGVAGVLPYRRDDIVVLPLTGLPPLPLGLTWCTAHENARIRALAATAGAIAPRHPPAPRLPAEVAGPAAPAAAR